MYQLCKKKLCNKNSCCGVVLATRNVHKLNLLFVATLLRSACHTPPGQSGRCSSTKSVQWLMGTCILAWILMLRDHYLLSCDVQ